MNAKLCKVLRKCVGYNPTTDRTTGDDYDIRDTSEVVGYQQRGVNADGTPILQKVVAIKCTATLNAESKRGKYKQLKKELS